MRARTAWAVSAHFKVAAPTLGCRVEKKYAQTLAGNRRDTVFHQTGLGRHQVTSGLNTDSPMCNCTSEACAKRRIPE
jgi:hypothetical protein